MPDAEDGAGDDHPTPEELHDAETSLRYHQQKSSNDCGPSEVND